ncbi:hypothetical protein JM658_07625 [Joostella atrarenae]|uniref:Surface glycan-binding protein B xyloglucan binding domain-containing protein n=1 Tax=Joostella atrarenae TaxID=679257 RepID=A0ABS9J2R0_9FLAO|nr:hypothetical protein [Joostella atrarenae]MCF8714695.1 hypothetical protein [Joostella atrarenae]
MKHLKLLSLLSLVLQVAIFASCDKDEDSEALNETTEVKLLSIYVNDDLEIPISPNNVVKLTGFNLNKVEKIELVTSPVNIVLPFDIAAVPLASQARKHNLTFTVPLFQDGELDGYGEKTINMVTTDGSIVSFPVILEEPSLPLPPETIPLPDGYYEVLFSDFNGAGIPEAQEGSWGAFGVVDKSLSGVQTEEVVLGGGGHLRIVWDGNKDFGFGGVQTLNFSEPDIVTTETDASKVMIVFSAKVDQIGLGFNIVPFEPGQPFTQTINFDTTEWKEYAFELSSFGVGYGTSNQSFDINPANLEKLQFSISVNSAPSATILIDNVRFYIKE